MSNWRIGTKNRRSITIIGDRYSLKSIVFKATKLIQRDGIGNSIHPRSCIITKANKQWSIGRAICNSV